MPRTDAVTTFSLREEDLSQSEAVPVKHAVILAAGTGSRFGKVTCVRPKPLIEVAGVPLILRTVRTAHKAGIDSFTVVTGYKAECLEDFLKTQTLAGIEFRFVRNSNWRLPNGLSVLKAAGHQPEPFVLLMADHLFEEGILKRLLSTPLPSGRCRLAVDRRPENIPDLEDATKVQVEGGFIRDIGKQLTQYNAVDTGIFLCSHGIFNALEESVAGGEQSLSDGVRTLARRSCMEAVDIGDLFWLDVDDEQARREGEKRLQQRASKTDAP